MKYKPEDYIESGFYSDDTEIENHIVKVVCCRKPHKCANCQKQIEIGDYALAESGFIQDWSGETVFCNPPYGRELPKWIRKCFDESTHATVVMLIPARTDTKAFHEYIYGKADIRFVKGRLRFGASKNTAPFLSMVIVFNDKKGRCD